MRGLNTKPKLARVGIFGANAHIGLEVARKIKAQAPDTRLKLIVRSEKHRPALEQEFPGDEVVLANYYDLPSLEVALAGLQGLYIVTPDFLDEERAMTNLVYAARASRGIMHIVRLLADPPGMTYERVPNALRKYSTGIATQHLRAKVILENSGLPITYTNIASAFMQNFMRALNPPLRAERVLAMPRDRRSGFIDSADIAACVAAILLSPNQRHIGQTYHLDNGHDVMWLSDVADMMSDAFGEKITFDGSDETFLRLNGPALAAITGRPDAPEYFLNYFQFEQDNDTIWRKTDIVEFLTGRPATRMYDWLVANKTAILG